jgi:hypothetical protein
MDHIKSRVEIVPALERSRLECLDVIHPYKKDNLSIYPLSNHSYIGLNNFYE